MDAPTPPVVTAADSILSRPRMETYKVATGSDEKAFDLYCWNAQVSSKFMVPIHFAEVSLRNVVNEALTDVYGPLWPNSQNLQLSLPRPRRHAYSPRGDLEKTVSRYPTTGKVVAELKFAFWVSMFTQRHHARLWKGRISSYFPETALTDEDHLRDDIRKKLDDVRILRNRIAHHEPVFTRDLQVDLANLTTLVKWRSSLFYQKLQELEEVSAALANRPH